MKLSFSDEPLPPRDIFEHLQTLYELAGSGSQVSSATLTSSHHSINSSNCPCCKLAFFGYIYSVLPCPECARFKLGKVQTFDATTLSITIRKRYNSTRYRVLWCQAHYSNFYMVLYGFVVNCFGETMGRGT
jgi:hypothetical protein